MLRLKLQYFGHLMGRADSWENNPTLGTKEGKRRGLQQVKRVDSIIVHEFEQTSETAEGSGAWCAADHGIAELDMTATEQS